MTDNSSLKAELVEALATKEATITFTKKDGSERVMRCTRNIEKMDGWQPSESGDRVIPDNLLPVWDLENNGWRSINIDTISRVEIAA